MRTRELQRRHTLEFFDSDVVAQRFAAPCQINVGPFSARTCCALFDPLRRSLNFAVDFCVSLPSRARSVLIQVIANIILTPPGAKQSAGGLECPSVNAFAFNW